MPKKEKSEDRVGVCISSDRKFPSTAATQLQDNAVRPFWSFKDTASAADDFFDCYVSFKELNCHEYVWDWKGRKMDELLVKKLVSAYNEFFRARPLGRNFFITFRVGNNNDVEELGRLYMSVITSNDFVAGQGMFSPPLFEVVHSAASSNELIRFAKLYNECVGIASEKLGHDCGPKMISVIPAHRFSSADWYSYLDSYLARFQSSFRCKMDYFRPLIPRSELADRSGFVASVLATKRVLSNYAAFSQMTGIESLPIIDVGPLMFRGGLNPSGLRNFIETYPGIRTATITPAFRYDHPLEEVKESVAALNRLLPRNSPLTYTRQELARMALIEKIFAKHYRAVLKRLPDICTVADEPDKLKRPVETRLRQSFSLYSLGIPPELIGAGSAVLECIKEGLVRDLEYFYPNIKEDFRTAGALLNKENLKFLAKMHKGWKFVEKDVKLVEDYTDSSLGPDSTRLFLHRNHTSNVFHLWSTKRDFARDILAAARLRKCMG